MLSLAVSSTDLNFSSHCPNCLGFQSFASDILFVDVRSTRRWRRKLSPNVVSLSCLAVMEGNSMLRFSDFVRKRDCGKISNFGSSGFVRRCKDWDSGADFALEAEILEFMKYSKNPDAFPTKKELIVAGRMDLVDAVVKKGGWLSFGWDVDEEEEDGRPEIGANGCCLSLVESKGDSVKDEMMESEGDELQVSGVVSSFSEKYSQLATSSGRSVELEATDNSGVEGILNRLEKQRNDALGFGFKQHEYLPFSQNNVDKEEWHSIPQQVRLSVGSKGIACKTHRAPTASLFDDVGSRINGNGSLSNADSLKDSLNLETWRTWSIQRAGSTEEDFEAAEIAPSDLRKGSLKEIPENEILEITEFSGKLIDNGKESDCLENNLHRVDIRSRLHHMQSELSTVLHSLRSITGNVAAEKDRGSYSDQFQTLSDAWEFQENEFMDAQDRLRSIRAKLAVLEGKMALAIIDAQNIVEEKQKRIDDAHRALRLLQTTWIVWPNAASEVLLAGSYDGWATQRKMEKSSSGIFSLCLKLYPGRYEIKFIVDGEWKVDPLRPIVTSGDYENNILIIS